MFKKLTALIISLAMVIGAIQFNAVSVFAEAQITTNGGLSVFTQDNGGIEYDSAAGLVTISGAGEFLVWGSTDQETIKVTDSTDEIRIVLLNVSIESSTAAPVEVDCGNKVAIHFEGSCSLISNSDDQDYPGVNYAGIQKTSVDNTLVIGGLWGGTETLTVQGGYKSAGIGGAQGSPGKNITIDNGTVTAYGGMLAAGIGGGCDYYGTTKSTVTINGGTVYAYGGGAAAGIGSGRGNSVGNNVITINGGTVYAYGGSDKDDYYGGAGIGGAQGDGGDVTITGGTVYAYGAEGAAGIGAGCTGTIQNRTISISGGTVYAQGGAYYNAENDYYIGGAGIGSGYGYGSGTIKITGGSIVAEETLTELAASNNDTIPDGYISDIGIGYYGYNYPSTVNISATESNGAIFLGDGDTTAQTAYGVTPSSGTVYKNKGSDKSTYPVYVYTKELEFDPEFALSAVVEGSVTDFNANDEITVDLVVSSESDDANVGSFQFALDDSEGWFTLKSVTPVNGTLSALNADEASASMTGLNINVDSTGKTVATAVLKVNDDITTTEDAEISFDTAGKNVITPTGSTNEITPAMTGTTVDIYNIKVTFEPGNSTFGNDDVTEAYVRYNETGFYKDNTYTEAVSVPTPTANEGCRLAAGTADEPLWSDGTNTYTDDSDVEGAVFTADTTLTVQTVKQYTVTISPADSSTGILYKDGTAVTADTAYTVDENSTLADLGLTFVTADNTSYMLTGLDSNGTTVASAALDTAYVTEDTAISPVIEPNSFNFETIKEDQNCGIGLKGVTDSWTVSYGTDVTFTLDLTSGTAVYSVYYTVGDDLTTYSLTPDSSDIYTIDGTAILGDIKVYINVKKYHKITLSQGEGNEMTAITGYVWDSLAGIYKTIPGLGTGAETYTASEISAAPSETEGYRLAADSADEPLWTDGTSFYTTAALTGTQTFTEETALTAVSVKQYTVTFASGGNGTVEETSRVVDTGSTLGTLPKVNPADYYTFSGWEIGSDTYTDIELLALTITKDITVTALFEPSKYSVTFANSNYGTFEAVSGVDADGYGAYLTDIVFTFDTTENVEYVFYSVGGNTRTVSESNGVYTISGSEVTGAVSIYYDSSDMAVYTFYVDDADAEKGSLTGSTAFILSSGGSLTETQVNSIGISEGTGYTFDHWEVTKEGDVITASVSLADLADDVLSGSALEVVSADLAEETYVGRTYTNDALLSLTADRNLTFKAVFELTDFNVTDENGKAVISDGLTNGYAHMGDDLVFSFDSGIVYYAAYKIGDGTETVLTGTADSEGNFTIPGSVITDDVTIITKTAGSEYELISHDDYLGEEITAGDGKQIVLIETSKLDSGNFALTDGSEFFYSESYGAYVMWVDESETVKTINGKLTTSSNEVSDVDYTGDINGTGVVTAGDAGMINDILENNWSYEVTDAQLFSLDVDQTESPKQVYTSDIVWVLEESIGLTH